MASATAPAGDVFDGYGSASPLKMNLPDVATCVFGVASAPILGCIALLRLPDWVVICAFVGVSALMVGLVPLLPLLPWVVRNTDFVAIMRRHLQRFAPLYFVAGPPAVVYFAMGGGLSIVALSGFRAIQVHLMHHQLDTFQQWEQHGLVAVLKGTEYVCSFVGAFVFAWIIRWARLPRFWFVILAVSLCVSAAYRTARHEPGQNRSVTSGPAILKSPEWMDALPVLIGMGALALRRRSTASATAANQREQA